MIANKKDKEKDREVPTIRGEAFAKEKCMNGFIETSAKSGENVEKAFMSAAKELFKQHWATIRE